MATEANKAHHTGQPKFSTDVAILKRFNSKFLLTLN
ncbi:unnamed protein product [Linum tenue]|uniref:Uncharacterized protein n=1 Tax=Linum tenue TaxID=586396 RepID=A0AAV0RSD8_9ROSI|nr:unnamed protein product [Linum tenue]